MSRQSASDRLKRNGQRRLYFDELDRIFPPHRPGIGAAVKARRKLDANGQIGTCSNFGEQPSAINVTLADRHEKPAFRRVLHVLDMHVNAGWQCRHSVPGEIRDFRAVEAVLAAS